MPDAITYSRDGGRATLSLNRPETHNRLSEPDLGLLMDHLERAEADPAVRVVVLTSAPGPTFCAGFAIDELQQTDWRKNTFSRAVERLTNVRVPTVCIIGGNIFGGACELALACDLRIGTPGITLQVPPARLGLVYFPSGLRRFVARLGPGPTMRMFLAAEKMRGDELHRIGVLDYLVAEDGLGRETDELAGRISALAPDAVRAMKATIDRIVDGTLDEVAALDRAIASFASAEAREGIAAFREKRKPDYGNI